MRIYQWEHNDITTMSCEIKNEKCPFQIQCLFPTAADTDTRPFALYFYSSHGSQERVLVCAYIGHHTCFHEKGFEITHTGFNDVTITVPGTFATTKGFFLCQKGDIHMANNCLYNPQGPNMKYDGETIKCVTCESPAVCYVASNFLQICNTISSTESGTGIGTTTKDINPEVYACVVIGLIFMAIFTFFCLSKKYRLKSCSRFTQCLIWIAVLPVIVIEKFQKYFLGKENRDNRVNQTTTDPTSFSFNGGNMKTNGWIHRDNELTIKENVDQQHASTDTNSSGASSGSQLSPSSSFSRQSSSRSDASLTPLLSHPNSTVGRLQPHHPIV